MYNNNKEMCESVPVEQKQPIQNEVEHINCNLELCEKLQADLIIRLNIILNQEQCERNCKDEQDEPSRVEAPIPLCSELRRMSDRLENMVSIFHDTLYRLGI